MLLLDVKKYFGSSYAFTKKTGFHHANYKNWAERGYIPLNSQIKLEKISNGAIKANIEHVNISDNQFSPKKIK
jgi:hypothetical protein